MPHLDADAIALHALGEPLRPADALHLEDCAVCAGELVAYRAAVTAGRAAGGEQVVPPPDAVWERISAELGLAPDVAPQGAVGADAADAIPGPDLVAVEPIRRRGRARWVAAVAAGFVAGAVGGGAAIAAALRSETEPDRAETVLAEATLDALPGWSAVGDAVLEEAPDGTMTLVVRVSPTTEDGFRAVWLLDADATRLVSLGALDGDEGRFTIPAGLDLAEYPVVDVSAEPFDGDPAHSGDSIVRGVLAG